MKNILIDSKLFVTDIQESKGLISALLELNSIGCRIYTDNISSVKKEMVEILSNEGITISESEYKDKSNWNKIYLNNSDDGNGLIVSANSNLKNILEASKAISKPNRVAETRRNTKETKILIEINLDGEGSSLIKTGIGFFDHMLEQIARHGNIDLNIKVDGDLHVDEHHTVEDVGIVFGETVLKALGKKSGIKRYGYFLPMDDSIAKVALDIGGRQYLNFKCNFKREFLGEFPTELTEEFFKGVAQGMKANIYIRAKGKNDHHKIESIFKAFAKALNEACRFDERSKGKLPSTKGVI